MKFKNCFCLLVLLQIGLILKGQNSSLLWEITGNSLKKPSYLYGTMHWPDKRIMQLGDSVVPKLMGCDVIAGELDLNEKPDMSTAMKMMLPTDTSLKMLLMADDYLLAKKLAKERLGLLMATAIDKIKPIYVYFLLLQSEKKEAKKEVIVDDYFQKVARKNGKKVVGLESMAEQMSALDEIKMVDQVKMLSEYLRYGEQESGEMDKMLEIYLSQDLNKLDSFIVHSEMPDEMNKAVLLERNYKMLERLKKLILTQPTFIAVGAAHLAGKEGLLELLKKEGYTVRPVISSYNPKKTKKRNQEK